MYGAANGDLIVRVPTKKFPRAQPKDISQREVGTGAIRMQPGCDASFGSMDLPEYVHGKGQVFCLSTIPLDCSTAKPGDWVCPVSFQLSHDRSDLAMDSPTTPPRDTWDYGYRSQPHRNRPSTSASASPTASTGCE